MKFPVFNKLSVIFICLTIVVIFSQVKVCSVEKQPRNDTTSEVEAKVVPDHEIKYEESLSPDWKVNWDLARSLYREKKYPEALVQYEILFTQKENIIEARWEYVSILISLERWENAKTELEKLLSAEPESIRYRIAMAKVSKELGNLENSVALYSQLLKVDITDDEKIEVLKGLIQTHKKKGENEKIPALLEQLIILVPDDFSLKLQQASLELEFGKISKAKDICTKLEENDPRNTAVLSLQARIEVKLNNPDSAATYWQKVVALSPDNTEAHRNLYSYYFDKQNWAKSFKHLEQLLRITPNNVDLLEKAADLNMRLDRIDRALEYYEFALAVDPLNEDILKAKSMAQKRLAQDLLALVENDEENKLWQDLIKVAPDSIGVYREIANLLREKGKIKELINVLRILYKNKPKDKQIYEELASLLKQQGMDKELAALQENSTEQTKTSNQN